MFQNTDPHCQTSKATCIAVPGLLAACPFHLPVPSAATPATYQDPHLPWFLKCPSALARRTKQLRSSSKQAAGRAWPGRGPRVPRKPQAAQVEPGRRHRKSRVSSLPFLRGDPVTRKREVPPERRQPARVPTPARGSSDPAVQSQVRAELPPAARRGRVHRQPGGGRRRVGRAPGGEAGEGRAGGGGANASRPPCPRPPGALRRPARGTGRRRGRRAPSAVGYGSLQPGLPAPESPRCQSARAASSWFAHAPPVLPGAGHS